jgi:hypothetical protein
MREAAKTTPPFKCFWCRREMGFTFKSAGQENSVEIIAAHLEDSPGPWIEGVELTGSYRERLILAATAGCVTDDSS